jgi:hypothetical protein
MSKKITKKSGYVVDTNVLCVASGKADHAEDECVENAVRFLFKIQESKSVVYLDEVGEIFSEYKKKNQPLGKNGKPGDQFLSYLIQSMGNKNLVKWVEANKDEEGNYSDFPLEEGLKKFDKSDRKFVAVAIASNKNPEILNAVDSDWKDFEAALKKYVKLKFLCK